MERSRDIGCCFMGYVRIAESKLNEFDQKDDFFEKMC